MTTKFKVGDIVLCEDTEGRSDLEEGVDYRIVRIDEDDEGYVYLDGILEAVGGWRFSLAKRNRDNVNSPSHYNSGGIECIDAIQAALTPEEFRGYLKGNILKYCWRELNKNGLEDCKKAAWYNNKLVEVTSGN